LLYVDGLLHGSTDVAGDAVTTHTMRLKGLGLKDLREAMDSVLKAKSTATTPALPIGPNPRRPPPSQATLIPTDEADQPVMLIDSLDFLLASQPDISTLSLQSFLSTLRSQAHSLVLTMHADDPLLQIAKSTDNDTGTDLERNHAHFLTSLAHQSSWIWQLRGLDTGSAKEVSGVIRVSRGASFEEDEGASSQQELRDCEWLYQLKGDGSVRVWGRGE
jgi:hypothetical protein